LGDALMTRPLTVLGPLLALLVVAAPALASGGSRAEPSAAAEEAPPQQLAMGYYNDGLASRDSAAKLRKKAADPSLSPEKRKKIETKIQRAYTQAAKSFTRAVENDPGMFQAWGSLGYARRMTGDYVTAIEAYSTALSLNPDYAEALEYLGEAYLGLRRIEDVERCYATLAEIDDELATELLSAAHAWIDQRRRDPQGVKVGELDAFERWVGERLEGAPVASTLGKPHSW
jgi:tetratricopeptide (TPR) repeat protein